MIKRTKVIECPSCGGVGAIGHFEYINGGVSANCWSECCPDCKGKGTIEVNMTNIDNIRSMSVKELEEFLISIAFRRETPWSRPFSEKFCKNCKPIIATVEEFDEPQAFCECDFVDGVCPYGSDIEWWLQQPVGDEDE